MACARGASRCALKLITPLTLAGVGQELCSSLSRFTPWEPTVAVLFTLTTCSERRNKAHSRFRNTRRVFTTTEVQYQIIYVRRLTRHEALPHSHFGPLRDLRPHSMYIVTCLGPLATDLWCACLHQSQLLGERTGPTLSCGERRR